MDEITSSFGFSCDNDKQINAIKQVLQISKELGIQSDVEVCKDATKPSQLYQTVAHLQELECQQKKLLKLNHEVQMKLLIQDSEDIIGQESLEEKKRMLEQLTTHLQNILKHKDMLVMRLQQPLVESSLKIDISCHRYVAESLPLMANLLLDLDTHLDNIKWIGRSPFDRAHLEDLLFTVSRKLVQMQMHYQIINKHCQAVDRLYYSQDNPEAEKDTN